MGFKFNPFTGNFDVVDAGSGAGDDFHSGYNIIADGETVTVLEAKQMINFTMLTLDGDLNLEGDLWQA